MSSTGKSNAPVVTSPEWAELQNEAFPRLLSIGRVGGAEVKTLPFFYTPPFHQACYFTMHSAFILI